MAIDKLWKRFENRYGSLWMDRWAGLPQARVKAEWADDLAGFTPSALSYGFDAVKGSRFPPTLPEFVDACRNAPKECPKALPAPNLPPEVVAARKNKLAGFLRTFGKTKPPGDEAEEVAA